MVKYLGFRPFILAMAVGFVFLGALACGDDGGTTDAGLDSAADSNAGCGNDACDPTETAESCPADCPAICGDGETTHDEGCDGDTVTCETAGAHPGGDAPCLADCSAYDADGCQTCGDDICQTDLAEDAVSCPADCDEGCGDELCTGTETASTCPGDCPAACSDTAVTHDEVCDSDTVDCADLGGYAGDTANCLGDCTGYNTAGCRSCGDGTCDLGDGENATSCATDCPESCGDDLCTGTETASICPADCPAVCGDSMTTHAEACDGDSVDCGTLGAYPGDLVACLAGCAAYDFPSCRGCGDLTCDAADGEDAATCASDCADVCGDSLCTGAEAAADCPADCPAVCGDGARTHAEVCDGGDTDCGGVGGYPGDAAPCLGDCSAYDPSGCRTCGDGTCDGGDGETPATCVVDCPVTCGDTMCNSGENASTCPADCPAVCGDGDLTHSEACEGDAVACPTLGAYYPGDDASCNGTCTAYDPGSCRSCGDGTVDASEGEACDGGAIDCSLISGGGFPSGTANCDASCAWDTSTCDLPSTCDVYYDLAGSFQITDTFAAAGDLTVPGLEGRLLLRYRDDGAGNVVAGPVELRHISMYQVFDVASVFTTVHNFAPACNGETAPTWRLPTDPGFPTVCEYDGVDRGPVATGSYAAGAVTWDACASADYWAPGSGDYLPTAVSSGPGCLNGYHSVGDVDCRQSAGYCSFGNLLADHNNQNQTINLPQMNGPAATGDNSVAVSSGEVTVTTPTGAAGGFQSINIPNANPSRTWLSYVATRNAASIYTTCAP